MSRSYRHSNFATINDKTEKKYANRRVRRTSDLFNNGTYRKIGERARFRESFYTTNEKYLRK